MKKRTIWIIFGIVVVLAIVAMLVFVINGKKDNGKLDSLVGTWLILSEKKDGEVIIPEENHFFVFTEEKVEKYIENQSESIWTDLYKYTGSNTLSLKELGVDYHTENKGNGNYTLWQNDDNNYNIVRYLDDDRKKIVVDTTVLVNRWDVVYRTGEATIEEIVFTDHEMKDYRDGKEEPYLTSNYTWDGDKTIVLKDVNLRMRYVPISQEEIIFVEESTGNIVNIKLKK